MVAPARSIGYVAMLPFIAWGVLADFLKNVAITASPLVASQTGFASDRPRYHRVCLSVRLADPARRRARRRLGADAPRVPRTPARDARGAPSPMKRPDRAGDPKRGGRRQRPLSRGNPCSTIIVVRRRGRVRRAGRRLRRDRVFARGRLDGVAVERRRARRAAGRAPRALAGRPGRRRSSARRASRSRSAQPAARRAGLRLRSRSSRRGAAAFVVSRLVPLPLVSRPSARPGGASSLGGALPLGADRRHVRHRVARGVRRRRCPVRRSACGRCRTSSARCWSRR